MGKMGFGTQNGINGSTVRTGGPLLLLTCYNLGLELPFRAPQLIFAGNGTLHHPLFSPLFY